MEGQLHGRPGAYAVRIDGVLLEDAPSLVAAVLVVVELALWPAITLVEAEESTAAIVFVEG